MFYMRVGVTGALVRPLNSMSFEEISEALKLVELLHKSDKYEGDRRQLEERLKDLKEQMEFWHGEQQGSSGNADTEHLPRLPRCRKQCSGGVDDGM